MRRERNEWAVRAAWPAGLAAFVCTAACVSAPVPPAAPEPRLPPVAALSSLPEAARTRVTILATSHLSTMEGVTQGALAPLIDQLAEAGFAAVAIERMPAREIEGLLADPALAPLLDTYLGEEGLAAARAAQGSTGLSGPEAAAAMTAWTGAPSMLGDAERRTRLLTALAAYELETAILYRRSLADGGVPPAVDGYLRSVEARPNERVMLAVVLAERLGLPRLWQIDSQADKDLFAAIQDALAAGFEASGAVGPLLAGPPYADADAMSKTALASGDLLPLYRYLNGAAYAEADVRGQYDFFNRHPFPNEAGRARQAAWDERNYRIAANIRRVTAYHPGEGVLVVIGAGHKPFLDELLCVALDLRVVQPDLGPALSKAPSP